MRSITQDVFQCSFDFPELPVNPSPSQGKRCTMCKETKPLDQFAPRGKERRGYASWCKECTKTYLHERYIRVKNGVLSREEPAPTKRCVHCHEYKSLDQFSPHDLAHDGLQSVCNHCLDVPASELTASCKQCTLCHLWLPFSDFHTHRTSRDGLTWWCKKCYSKRAKEARTPDNYRKHNLRHHYGLTPEQYESMLKEQGGVCAACKQPETHRSATGIVRPLCVDHDHCTGLVRGLLCHECNTAYGLLREDKDRILALLAYHEQQNKP